MKAVKCYNGSYFSVKTSVLPSFYVISIPARVTGDEGTSIEKIHLQVGAIGKLLDHFLSDVGRGQLGHCGWFHCWASSPRFYKKVG